MSLIKAISHQIGMAADAAKNFIFSASAQDGTMTLKRESGQLITSYKANGVVVNEANKVSFKAILSTSYAVPAAEILLGTTNTSITFDPTNSFVGGKFKPQVAGYYQANCSVSMQGGGTITYLAARIKKNGVEFVENAFPPYGGLYGAPSVSQLFYLNGTTDYLEFFASNGSTANGTLSGFTISAVLSQPT